MKTFRFLFDHMEGKSSESKNVSISLYRGEVYANTGGKVTAPQPEGPRFNSFFLLLHD